MALPARFQHMTQQEAPGEFKPVQQILLYSYGYTPSPIVLAAGKPVTLTFVNRAGKGHDFTAPNKRVCGTRAAGAGVVRMFVQRLALS